MFLRKNGVDPGGMHNGSTVRNREGPGACDIVGISAVMDSSAPFLHKFRQSSLLSFVCKAEADSLPVEEEIHE
jgi:hypothetical protein